MDVTYEQLQKYVKMEQEEDIRKFELGIWSFAKTKDPARLELLIDLFNDECPYSEVMYSLVHTIESYPKDIYIDVVLKKIEKGVRKYPIWMDCVCNRIFNDFECLKYFKDNMHKADKDSLLKLFDIMEQESSHHRELISELRKSIVSMA